ncbi:histidinol phosphatase [Sporanaerobium hydrogeniformans]|uniref:Histidinol phosphatase n=1 Tax=Sporanaerobium hydrogeniformans TaxID=3072179 RepID=A0AC61DG50_9FIRM|nr:PHP domain-containing protein [Sporanaerobium hydrogeniformans]PHV72229.1 histidinol phosphatase [Sporanaerobium hydrogeniformans]
MTRIDLHTHTKMSDGTSEPKEIIKQAVLNNVEVVAITDHDTLDALEEAGQEAKAQGICFIPGIELTCPYGEGRLLHILGLGIDIEEPCFKKAYIGLKERKEKRLQDILQILEKEGVVIPRRALEEAAYTQYLDRVDIIRYLYREGKIQTAVEGWNKYLDPIPYGARELIGVDEALELIQKAGGVSVLAHYPKNIGFKDYPKNEIVKHLSILKRKGLMAIERYYPSFTESENQFAQELIEKQGFLASGGTDFHGKNRPGIDVGITDEGFTIPYSVYEKMAPFLHNQIK